MVEGVLRGVGVPWEVVGGATGTPIPMSSVAGGCVEDGLFDAFADVICTTA